ncbi:stage III sporulation protein AE [Geosporobacter ferrireducens]|nr:stage III sporulation protein AE [Geosporobacter ferrireducens]
MKRLTLILIFFFLMSTSAYGMTQDTGNLITDDMILSQLQNMNTDDLEKIINQINGDTENYLPKIDLKEGVRGLIRGESNLTLRDTMNGLFRYLFKEIVANSMLLIRLIVLAIICAFLNNLSDAFESNAVGKLAYIVCYLVIIAIAIQSFSIATAVGIAVINDMVMFMQALLPLLLTLLMAMGGITSSAMFQPIIIAAVGTISTLMKDIIMPIIFFSAILSIVNNLSSKIHVSKLASLLKQACVVLLGFTLTVFIGIITIQGVAASTTDGVTIRTAKFAVDRFIPVVGGFISEAVDAIIGCSLLLKNAIGALGLFSLAFIVIMPLLKIFSLIVIYKIAAAIIEPITDSQLVSCLNDMSSSLVLIFATVLSVAVMFFMAVTVIVGAGNLTLMMR